MTKILIVEDDNHILTGLIDNLKLDHYQPLIARDGNEALRQIQEKQPNLILLDVMLPKLNGFEVCKELKKRGVSIPIIILSGRGQEADKVLGLELGADDYVTKPFSPRELLVRIKAVLRRAAGGEKPAGSYRFGEVEVDFKRHEVAREGHPVKLTAGEFKILELLIANKGEPVSRHRILSAIWNEEVTSRTVDTHLWRLREKLEKDPAHPRHLLTVHRIGYRFVE